MDDISKGVLIDCGCRDCSTKIISKQNDVILFLMSELINFKQSKISIVWVIVKTTARIKMSTFISI